jgi:hemolysin activation/secretion protein
VRVRLSRHIGSGSTPFPFLPSLGGSSGLRGYSDGRFTGDWALLVNAELRQRIFSLAVDEENRFDFALVLFGDAGQVADHMEVFRWDRFHLDGGLGARMSLPGGGSLRADFALSPEGLGIQMGLGELF